MNSTAPASKKALILGAGIGGLMTALFLQEQGWDIVIYEKKQELSEFGAGLVLAANALHVLDKLGLAEKVKQAGARVGRADIRSWQGNAITAVPVDQQAALYGTYSYLIHRAKLQGILVEHLNERATLHMNKRLIALEQAEQSVAVRFEDGTEDTGHILIGADGIHSQAANVLFGRNELRYSGFKALRGITPYKDQRYLTEIGGGFEAWGKGKRFGFSQIGENQVFWFAAINAAQGAEIVHKKEFVLKQLEGWHDPIEDVIRATEENSILVHDIYDRKPLARWSIGRVTLLGDAAHPMLPNLGQGGAQAMEDAYVLTDRLADVDVNSSDAIRAAFTEYEKIRMPRVYQVVRHSRRMARLVQMSSPLGILLRNQLLSRLPAKLQIKQLDGLLGHRV
ncbi:FAD-dependent monooxygenase [Paenibacillus alba]|uniref:FAD-dependent monooxygenase n=1 Tax=Paenibacillus alba TaxID=1197127 RepID=A0ABU6GEB9_9BACL|nr:FAD-dependent monooxygenase [Paenibacillus alba]MEC0232496.1 FAD-dependent monooxygenase [Paenibacillus alba]